jgi:hypothetical protein
MEKVLGESKNLILTPNKKNNKRVKKEQESKKSMKIKI